MEKKVIYIILIIVTIIVALIFLLKKPKIVMTKTFKPTIEITNGTKFDIDTTLLTIADKIMSLDTLEIHIYYSQITMEKDGIIVNTFAQKNPMPHSYTIFIGKNVSKGLINKVLAHEMAHVRQYESGLLIPQDNKTMIYKGDKYYLPEIPYEKRPFEIDAFNEQYQILSMLNRIVYK
jgi:hypothetical protein